MADPIDTEDFTCAAEEADVLRAEVDRLRSENKRLIAALEWERRRLDRG